MASYDICIVDYGMGNLMSVLRAFELIGVNAIVSKEKQEIRNAKRILLPGVGAFSAAMDNLGKLDLIGLLTEQVMKEKKPFLGICLGMQLIAEKSYEMGEYQGLSWIPAEVPRFPNVDNLRVPHMGWNDISSVIRERSLFEGIGEDTSYYFVHSYHVACRDRDYIGSTCFYGMEFVSSIQYENIYATQFHPEKSQKNGILLLQNFIKHTKNLV